MRLNPRFNYCGQQSNMPFGIFLGLKLKPAASEHFLSSLFLNPEGEGCPLTCSTEPDSLSSIDSSHQSFRNIILMGSVCVVGVFITKRLISWSVDGSQSNEVSIDSWSHVNRLIRGNGPSDEVDWENIPLQLWGEIGKRMVSRLDIISFRSVCKKWRSSLPSPTGRFPLVLPPPPSCDPKFRDMPYTITELNIYLHDFGVPFMQLDQGGIFQLSPWLSRWGDKADFEQDVLLAPAIRLRDWYSLYSEDPHNELYMDPSFKASSEISFFAKAYYPCMALDSPKIRHERQCNEFPKKVVLISSSNADGVNPNYARLCDLSVVAHLGGEMEGRLALLRLGGSSENWVWETDFCNEVFVNIATYKGRLCAVDRYGGVFLMDYNSLQLTQVCDPLSIPFEVEGKSLFESRGELYLADFEVNTGCDVEAYRLCLELQVWLKVEHMVDPIGVEFFKFVAPFLL